MFQWKRRVRARDNSGGCVGLTDLALSRPARTRKSNALARMMVRGRVGCSAELGGEPTDYSVHDAPGAALGGHAPIRCRKATIFPK